MAGATFVEQGSFQSPSVPLRFSGYGDSPKHGTFSEVTKIDVGGTGSSDILVDIPSTTSTPRKPREVHFWGRNVLDHRTETDQGSIRMNSRWMIKRQWRNLCRNMSADSLFALQLMDTHLLDGILCIEDGGKVRRDMRWKFRLCISTLIVEVYNDTGWISDGVEDTSGDHFVQRQIKPIKAVKAHPHQRSSSCRGGTLMSGQSIKGPGKDYIKRNA
jgi:hypothetical protein